ncbi:hypothetical protein P0082_09890 [Candidatus Haliotispira prima]|uniref:Sensory transduction regulator n=1 Tax=Candidatus Haliotispira prima TaxID=3034016 RepID=A0ABY8MGV7_9SPIO|nr:hypothetical protein P0082_09890 [Candidatus Haliotispira prima]
MDVTVRSSTRQGLSEFLEDQDYLVESLSPHILAVKSVGGPTVYIAQQHHEEGIGRLYFELSLGLLGNLEQNAPVLFKLLDLNSEITPVSVAVNSEDGQPRLCLVESLESGNLDNNEVLSVLEAMGLACLRVQQLLD